jgi:photosystem II stability/assembly factor-like uncharacterized protein
MNRSCCSEEIDMPFAKRTLVILVCLLAAPLAMAEAAENRWSLLGPDGGNVQSLAVDPGNPRILYAGILGGEGIFKSLDGGATWARSGAGLPKTFGRAVQALAVDPSRRTTVYAGTSNSGVYKSLDGGATWAPARQGLEGLALDVRALAVSPRRPGTVFAGTARGLFRSQDGGAHWQRVEGIPPGVAIWALAIDPKHPNLVYATGNSLFKSTDGGATWKESRQGIPGSQTPTALAIDPQRPATVYAGGRGAVYKSTNSGASWAATGGGLPESDVRALAVNPRDPRTLFAATPLDGIYRSDDAGASWSPANAGLSDRQVWTLAVTSQGTFYAGTARDGGVFRTEGRQPWSRTVRGLVATTVRRLDVAPGDPTVLWAATEFLGLYYSPNGGGVWRRAMIPEALAALDVAVDPGHPRTVYALVVFSSPSSGGGVKTDLTRTDDGGRTWERLPLEGDPLLFDRLQIDPRTGVLWLLGYGLRYSADGGRTWTTASGIEGLDHFSDMAFDPSSPQVLYAAGYHPSFSRFDPPTRRFYKSTDGGATWTRSETGLAGPGGLVAVALNPADPRVLYTGGGAELFRSADAGAHWEQVARTTSQGVIQDLVAGADGTLYIGTQLAGVFASRDGRTWRRFNESLASFFIRELELDPDDPDTLYAATENGGVEARTGLPRP